MHLIRAQHANAGLTLSQRWISIVYWRTFHLDLYGLLWIEVLTQRQFDAGTIFLSAIKRYIATCKRILALVT